MYLESTNIFMLEHHLFINVHTPHFNFLQHSTWWPIGSEIRELGDYYKISRYYQKCNKMVNDREAIVDIESNRSECEEVTRGTRVENMLRSLGLTFSFNGFDDVENSSDLNNNNDIESFINNKFEDEKRENNNMAVTGKTQLKDKQKVKNSKKACKPPRPRKGPSLSASDMRLVKEISELVMKKRARIERLRSLKKLRSAQLPSSSAEVALPSNMSVFAMTITVLFLIVIMFQGTIRVM